MGLRSNEIDRSMLEKGDHIYSYRKAHIHALHGEDRVVHYKSSSGEEKDLNNEPCQRCGYKPSKNRGVVKSCLDCFIQGHRLHRFEYGVSKAHYVAKRSGTCYTGSCTDPDYVVERANKMLNDSNSSNTTISSDRDELYAVFDQKCVCFAVICMTGSSKSAQAVAAKSKLKMSVKGFALGLQMVMVFLGIQDGIELMSREIDENDGGVDTYDEDAQGLGVDNNTG
ncbi:protein LEAD-SENSITIVE 1-like [Humulus lupulus]|uniref:protein LEAD-SENSITIVE 1-like n=1 Tax=Humulus lupulus TaxID=3486 RepID=UPI002B408CFF|nr:protein LEAD-SENSITIVE 1-like [Humulus lupulus]